MFKNLFNKYQRVLVSRPFLTNSISTAVICSTGDVIAQAAFPIEPLPIETDTDKREYELHKIKEINDTPQSLFASWLPGYDYKRTLRAAIYGGIVFAPIGDTWYKILAKIKSPFKINGKSSSMMDNFTRMFIDQVCFSPCGIVLYFAVMSFLETGSLSNVSQKLSDNYKDILLTNWMVWPVVQFANFSLVPVEFRLLNVNFVSIFWNCFLSYSNNKQRSE